MKTPALLSVMAALLFTGCAHYTDNRGIEVSWDPESVADFEIGSTDRNAVLARPPHIWLITFFPSNRSDNLC